MTRLRILHTVQFYHPQVGGSEEVVRRLSERLVEKGHEVTVATSVHRARARDTVINGVRVVSFGMRGNAVDGMRGDIAGYRRFVLEGRFDVMMNYAAQAWPTDAVFDILDSFAGVRVLVPCGYSGLRKPRYQSYFAHLPGVLRRYDHLVYLSETYQDKTYGDKHGITQYSVVPNAADEREGWTNPGTFRATHGLEDRLIVLCVANHLRSKGHLDLISTFKRAATTDAVLVIVGEPGLWRSRWAGCYYRCHLQALLSGGRVRLLSGLSRPDVVQAFAAADVFALASAVECSPLVLFESMASATPWLCTNVGNAPELPGGEVASRLSEFGGALAGLLRDRVRRYRLGQAGHAAWEERYSWRTVAEAYEALYSKLVAERRLQHRGETSLVRGRDTSTYGP